MIAGSLELQMSANLARLSDDMNKAKGMVGGAMKYINSTVDSTKTMLASLGVGLGVGYFVHLIQGSIDAADHLNDLSKSTNIVIADLAGLKLLANQTGTDLDGLAKGINKMSVAMGKDPEKFKALGITAKDNTHAFAQFADIFNLLPDINQRNALAMAAFGKSWAEIAPALSEGGAKILDTIEKGKRLSGMTQEMGVNADHFKDQLAELSTTLGKTSTQMLGNALPAMNQIIEAMVLAAREGGLLQAALVGVGGALAGIFTDDNMTRAQQIAKELQHLREENATAQKWGGPLAFFSDAMKDKLNTELNARNQRMIALQKELEAIQNLNAAKNKSNFTEEQAMALAMQKYNASLRASAFLGEQADAYDKVKKHAEDYIKTLQKETAQAGLDEIQKKMVEASIVSLTLHTVKEREAVMAAALAWADATRIGNEAKLAKEAQIRAAEDMIKAQQDLVIGLNREAVSLAEKAAAAEEENALIGKTAEQLAALTIARYDEQIALASAAKSAVPANAGREAEIVLIEQQIDALNRLKAATGAHVVLQKQADDLKKLSDDWKKFTDEIDRALTDALMRGFESGKSFGQNFVDSLKHSLETAALKIVVQAIVNPVMGGVQSMASGGSFMGGMGNAVSLFSAGSNAYSTLGGMFASGGGMASMAGSTAVMSSAYTAPAIATAAAAEAGTTGAASFMSSLSAAAPYIGLGLAAYSILTQDHGTPTRNLGDATAYFDQTGKQTQKYTYYGGSSTETDARIQGMQTSYMQAAMSLGIGTVATGFGYGANTGKDSASPNFSTYGTAGGVKFSTGGETPYSDAAAQLAASRAVFAALQGSELPQYLKGVFNGMTAGAMSQAQIDSTLAYAQTLKQMREALLETRTPLEIAKAQIMELTGALHTSADTFKTDFVSAIDAGINSTTLARWQTLGAAIDQASKATTPLVLDIAKFTTLRDYTRAQSYAANMPSFADGGAFGGGLRLVGENGPEVEYTGPSRIFSNSQSKSLLDTSGMIEELRALRTEVATLRMENQAGQVAIAGNTQKTAKIVDRWNGDGMPAVRTA